MPALKTQERQKTAFLTGSSSRIGKAAAAASTSAGYQVIRTSRRTDPDALIDGIWTIPCDVTSDESVAAAVARAHTELGHIDLLVNNAVVGVTAAFALARRFVPRALFDKILRSQFGLA